MIRPLALTPGEPAGIGPDVVLQLVDKGTDELFVVFASMQLMADRATELGLATKLVSVGKEDFANLKPAPKATLYVYDIPLKAPCTSGTLTIENAAYVLQTLDAAIEFAQQNIVSGIVTGPVHKGVINDAGLAFTGHTEYLRDACQVEDVVMMLATEGLRVALVTTHLPLKDVPAAITPEKLHTTIAILYAALQQDFGCAAPNILVTGLNPHAGEDGHLGREELDTIIPALDKLRALNINLTGPLPADTLFQPHYLDKADAVLAMYHDQGLPVLKYKGFGNAVNITLGLPFIRTSVDHGTAFDLAGTGKANTGSLITALTTAHTMAMHREQRYA
ncbi:4-hydroxythreonine-4-phosphate dehydrogenase PdxA [Reinekea sp.]|jgi:4-hydroxythreonine-4-phosphate dehydrogenase|uniref:4-hydroxythreonine-4-phosphate dehydrogenase PdxA n=1 Tax=Reinekea sp. TaxID=1970455 RepID=UPI0039898152